MPVVLHGQIFIVELKPALHTACNTVRTGARRFENRSRLVNVYDDRHLKPLHCTTHSNKTPRMFRCKLKNRTQRKFPKIAPRILCVHLYAKVTIFLLVCVIVLILVLINYTVLWTKPKVIKSEAHQSDQTDQRRFYWVISLCFALEHTVSIGLY